MVFAGIPFLFYFLPLLLAAYYLVPKRMRNAVLLGASIFFYFWGSGVLVLLLVISTLTDFSLGFLVAAGRRSESRNLVRLGVTLSVLVNVGLLGYFKYANFLVEQVNRFAESLGWGTIAWTSVVLPIGISFYTFQTMSYTIDLAMGRAEQLRNLVDFAVYVAMFPQLIAGPIVRYHEISEQLGSRTHTFDKFAGGVVRFAHGLAKKVIIADSVAILADEAFGLDPTTLPTMAAWIGVLAYTIQIYFDFSGYSDMAIGLGQMLGFRLPENFARPYSALSITDFWRRWHMTLSNWFRDYVYVPLGGSRGTAFGTYRNLWIVFILAGIWHGANWTFIIWGLYHGVLLVFERATRLRAIDASQVRFKTLRRAVVLGAVMVGWVLFRSPDLGHAVSYLGAMFSWQGATMPVAMTSVATNRVVASLVLGSITFLLPSDFKAGPRLEDSVGLVPGLARAALIAAALPYSMALLLAGSFSPFLYFQF